ncbi:MAG: hypothetical protein U0263_29330, partial [Polyangiaceae bacterium]
MRRSLLVLSGLAVAACGGGAPAREAAAPGMCHGASGCERACDGGEAAACYALLFLYSRGEAEPEPARRGFEKLEQACDAKEAAACRLLGASLLEGLGVKKDRAK